MAWVIGSVLAYQFVIGFVSESPPFTRNKAALNLVTPEGIAVAVKVTLTYFTIAPSGMWLDLLATSSIPVRSVVPVSVPVATVAIWL